MARAHKVEQGSRYATAPGALEIVDPARDGAKVHFIGAGLASNDSERARPSANKTINIAQNTSLEAVKTKQPLLFQPQHKPLINSSYIPNARGSRESREEKCRRELEKIGLRTVTDPGDSLRGPAVASTAHFRCLSARRPSSKRTSSVRNSPTAKHSFREAAPKTNSLASGVILITLIVFYLFPILLLVNIIQSSPVVICSSLHRHHRRHSPTNSPPDAQTRHNHLPPVSPPTPTPDVASTSTLITTTTTINHLPEDGKHDQHSTSTAAATPPTDYSEPPETGANGLGDDFVHNDNWFESTYARNAIAQYVFAEWYEKNLTDSLDNSTTDLFGSSSGVAPTFGHAGQLFGTSGGGGAGLIQVANSSAGLHVAVAASSAAAAAGGGGHVIPGGLHAQNNGTGLVVVGLPAPAPRPYMGDAFYSFQTFYWPYHCVISLVICTLGIFANLTNIIVLTRPNMITAVNTILSAMAFSDLIVNVTNIPYLLHELSDQTNFTSFFSFQWALYILFQAHTTVTAHTISIWLTCVLSTWRYLVVCRSQSSNQRNWSVGLAKRTIIGVFLIVPVFCIPNYLSFAIVKEVTEANSTIYKVGFSHLADESQFIKTFHFWIFSCLTKLVPCVLLTFFTTVLIRKLLSARERRLRLATYGSPTGKELEICKLPNGDAQKLNDTGGGTKAAGKSLLVSGSNHKSDTMIYSENNQQHLEQEKMLRNQLQDKEEAIEMNSFQARGSSCAVTDAEMVVISCDSGSGSGSGNDHQQQMQSRLMSQIIVESDANSTTTRSTAKAPVRLVTQQAPDSRSASTCGALELYGKQDGQPLETRTKLNITSSQDLSTTTTAGHPNDQERNKCFLGKPVRCPTVTTNPSNDNDPRLTQDKRGSENNLSSSRARSMGSSNLAPFQLIKLQAAQRQISQNETTTRLLIAVMIVFLICEFPAGILSALCAVLGQDFFENVYQPTGILMDLLALINSSVNFMIYCFMSTQFRITFYRVVLHCPAPQTQPHLATTNIKTTNDSNNPNNKEAGQHEQRAQ